MYQLYMNQYLLLTEETNFIKGIKFNIWRWP